MRLATSTLAAVALSASFVVAPATSHAAPSAANPVPVAPTINDLPIPKVSPAAARSLPATGTAAGGQASGRVVGAAVTDRTVSYDVVGVTFTGAAPRGLLVEARAHTSAGWGTWRELEIEPDEGPDPGSAEAARARAGTAAMFAADADGIDLRVSSATGAVPTGLSASLIDGGSAATDASLSATVPTADTSTATTSTATTSTATTSTAATTSAAPSIVTRAGWGADESLRPCEPTALSGFKAAVVHHTVNSNTYSDAQAASLMRGIYAYHTQSLGWCDVGYNFLVDRFGRAYEGRKGGLTGFIQGAQAGGFNEETFGVAVIGDYTAIPFGSATLEKVERIIAWQGTRSDFYPNGTVELTSAGSSKYPAGVKVVKPRIFGHRDTSLTSCPGDAAYAQLGAIRARATAYWTVGRPVSAPALFTPTSPRRVLDTRSGVGAPRAAVGPGSTITLKVPGLPSTATAAVLNLTATEPTAATYVTAYPYGSARSGTANLNLASRQTASTLVTVGVGAGGTVSLYNASGSVQLVADVAGYYVPGAGSGYTNGTPRRVLDTRPGSPLGAGRAMTLKIPGLPTGTRAVTLNLTATGASADGFVTAYPGGTTRPTASSLNAVRGRTVANLVTVGVGSGGTVNLYSDSASVDLVADLAGYYVPGSGARFVAVNPQRVLDTRANIGPLLRPVGDGERMDVQVPSLPTEATAVVATVTGVNASTSSYVTAYPYGITRPGASTLNVVPGRTVTNAAVVGLSPSDYVSLYNDAGRVDLVADVSGWFVS